jgi:hypothetical protein
MSRTIWGRTKIGFPEPFAVNADEALGIARFLGDRGRWSLGHFDQLVGPSDYLGRGKNKVVITVASLNDIERTVFGAKNFHDLGIVEATENAFVFTGHFVLKSLQTLVAVRPNWQKRSSNGFVKEWAQSAQVAFSAGRILLRVLLMEPMS